jgi:hypothetical protein
LCGAPIVSVKKFCLNMLDTLYDGLLLEVFEQLSYADLCALKLTCSQLRNTMNKFTLVLESKRIKSRFHYVPSEKNAVRRKINKTKQTSKAFYFQVLIFLDFEIRRTVHLVLEQTLWDSPNVFDEHIDASLRKDIVSLAIKNYSLRSSNLSILIPKWQRFISDFANGIILIFL